MAGSGTAEEGASRESSVADELSSLLSSQEMLHQSMSLTTDAMRLDNDGRSSEALELYIKASELLLDAANLDSNESFQSIISANLDSIMTRMKTLEERIAIENILNNIRQAGELNERLLTMQQHHGLLDDYPEPNQNELHHHNNDTNDSTTQNTQNAQNAQNAQNTQNTENNDNINDTNASTENDAPMMMNNDETQNFEDTEDANAFDVDANDIDDVLSNLYKQFYGSGPSAMSAIVPIEPTDATDATDAKGESDELRNDVMEPMESHDVSDITNFKMDLNCTNIDSHFLESLDEKIDSMIENNRQQRELSVVVAESKDIAKNEVLKQRLFSLELVPYGNDASNATGQDIVCKNRLIEDLPDSVTCFVFSFLNYFEVSSVLLNVNKYWRNELLTDTVNFVHLFKKLVIGSDPLLYCFGNNLSVSWLDNYFLKFVRQNCECLIISTGIANGALDLKIDDIVNVFQKNKFAKLKTLVFYSVHIEYPKLLFTNCEMIFPNLEELFCEIDLLGLDILEILNNLPNLRVLSATSIDCVCLSLPKSDENDDNTIANNYHIFPNIEFLTFVFGIDNENVSNILQSFPNIKHIGLEFDEMIANLDRILCDHVPKLESLHMSWNAQTFWKSEIMNEFENEMNNESNELMISVDSGMIDERLMEEEMIKKWLNGLNDENVALQRIMLDRDYVLTDYVSPNAKNTKSVEDILSALLPNIETSICPGFCTFNLQSFARYCDL